MISPYLSRKIRLMSLFSIVMIVVLHSNIIDYSNSYSLYFQKFMTQEITRVAVPFFFLISGFLFFRNVSTPWYSFFFEKINKRIWSLMVPYIILSTLGGIIWALAKDTGVLKTVLDSILISTKVFYQLWFLHDLIILVFLSPFIFIIIYKIPWLWLIPFYYWSMGYYNEFLNFESLFWWGLGGIMSIHFSYKTEVVFKRKELMGICGIGWIMFSVLHFYIKSIYLLHAFGIILGILFMWFGYDNASKHISNWVYNVAPYSFFIFIFHEPILTGVKYSFLVLFPINQNSSLMIYLLSPIITIFICIFIAKWWVKFSPNTYCIITGGR